MSLETTSLPTDPSTTPYDFVVAEFIAEVRQYIGCPWLHQGRTKSGIDCVGLIHNAGRSCGLHDYDDSVYYSRKSIGQDLLLPFRQHMTEIPLGPGRLSVLQPADILILRDRAMPQHAGIIAERYGKPTLIHSSAFYNKTIEEFIKEDHEKKAITAFRFRFLT